MLLIQLFSGLNCGVPNAAKNNEPSCRPSYCVWEWRCHVLVILLSRFQLRSATDAGRPVCRAGDPVANIATLLRTAVNLTNGNNRPPR